MSEINHLVISGGGINLFINYAILRDSHQSGFWSIDRIKTIYGTSSGAILAVLMCLKYDDWTTLDDYLWKRPWQNIFRVQIDTILSAFHSRGVFHYDQIAEFFSPLFRGKDLDPNITLAEFYEWSGIEIHLYTTELNCELSQDIDLSWRTHPDWKVIEAVYCSSALPVLFRPWLKDGHCFVDGGAFLNYPITPCIEQQGQGAIPHIFGLKRSVLEQIDQLVVDTNKTLLDTIVIFMSKIAERIVHKNQETNTTQPHTEIIVPCSAISLSDILLVIEKQEERKRLLDTGSQIWTEFREKSPIPPGKSQQVG